MKLYKIITTFPGTGEVVDIAIHDNAGQLIRGERKGPVGPDLWEWRFAPGVFSAENNCREIFLSQADLDAAEVVQYDVEKDGF